MKLQKKQLKMFEKYGLVIDGELNIYAVQVALITAGIDAGKPDGKRGNKTLSAIKRFQEASGLKPDGKVGLKTLKALSQYLEVVEKFHIHYCLFFQTQYHHLYVLIF